MKGTGTSAEETHHKMTDQVWFDESGDELLLDVFACPGASVPQLPSILGQCCSAQPIGCISVLSDNFNTRKYKDYN